MKSLLRAIVASPKKSYMDTDSDIRYDLAYITQRIIVCSGPTNHYIKNFYRYPIGDLVQLLTINHGESWWIWNFRGEGKGYDDDDVFKKISYYPFPDHQPPPLDVMLQSVEEIDDYLSENDDLVAVLHCKAGKGRSGTICCGYLLYKSFKENHPITVENAINLFTIKRMRNDSIAGVSILSQRRYLLYWYEFLTQYFAPNPTIVFPMSNYQPSTIRINKLTLMDVDSYYTKNDNVLTFNLIIYKYSKRKDYFGVKTSPVWVINSELSKLHSDDNKIEIYPLDHIILQDTEDVKVSIKDTCYSWFVPSYESKTNNYYDVNWHELDGFKGTYQRGIQLFKSCRVSWEYI